MALMSAAELMAAGQGQGGTIPGRAPDTETQEGGVMGELFQAIKSDLGKTIRSIPYLPEAVFTFGRDDGATEEVQSLRRRALATAVTTIGSFGLGALASTVARGVGIPLLGTILKAGTSTPGIALESGLTNIAFGRLDTAPGEATDDLANFIGGAAGGAFFAGVGKGWRIGRRLTGMKPPPVDPRVAKAGVEALTKDGGMGGGRVAPAVPKTRESAIQSFFSELNDNEAHAQMKGVAGRDARHAWASEVLGRKISTFSEITDVDDLKTLRDALRARRGEVPAGPKLTPTVVRLDKTMSTAFPDAAHKRLFDIGAVGKVTEPEAQLLSAQLGIPAEQVLEKAHLYSNLTKLAADVNKGETVLFKMPPLEEAIDQMPVWIKAGQQKVISRATPARPRVAKTAGDVAVARTVRKEMAAPPRKVELPEEGLPEVGARKGPAPPPVEAIRIGKRLVEVGPMVKGKVELKYAGKKVVVGTKELTQRLQEHVNAGRVIRVKREGKWVTRGSGARAQEVKGTPLQRQYSLARTARKELVAGNVAADDVKKVMEAVKQSIFTARPGPIRGILNAMAEEGTPRRARLEKIVGPIIQSLGVKSTGKIQTGAKGAIPDFVEELFGASKVVGKKPILGARVRREKVAIPIGDRAKMKAMSRKEKRIFQIKRILNRVEPKLGTTAEGPGARAMVTDLRAQLEKLEPSKAVTQALPARAAALARDREARARLEAEGPSAAYRKLAKVPDAESGTRPQVGEGDIYPAIRLKDGSVVIDTESELTDKWAEPLVKRVGRENAEKIGLVQGGEFYAMPKKVVEQGLPEVAPVAPPEAAAAPSGPKFGKGSRGPRPSRPVPVKPAAPGKGERWNYLMERANHPNPDISEVAKMHLKNEFGAEFPDTGPGSKRPR
jgi:hypothetical protein